MKIPDSVKYCRVETTVTFVNTAAAEKYYNTVVEKQQQQKCLIFGKNGEKLYHPEIEQNDTNVVINGWTIQLFRIYNFTDAIKNIGNNPITIYTFYESRSENTCGSYLWKKEKPAIVVQKVLRMNKWPGLNENLESLCEALEPWSMSLEEIEERRLIDSKNAEAFAKQRESIKYDPFKTTHKLP